MKQRTCIDYLADIVEAIDDTQAFTLGMTAGQFAADKKTVNAVVRSLEIIGEAAKSVPEEVRTQYPTIRWKGMAGMRDKITHEYFGVDLDIVWRTIEGDLPGLRQAVRNALKDMNV